jgi:serine/threonine-protein kinase
MGVAPSSPTEVHTPEHAEGWAPTQARTPEVAEEAWEPTQAGPPEHVKKAWAAAQAGTPQQVENAWAPTQNRPVENFHEPSPPEIRAPVQWPEAAAPPWPWWRRKAVVIPTAVIVMIAAVATILLVVSGGETNPRRPGTFDGTYAVDFGADQTPDGQPYGNPSGGPEQWVIKSACQAEGCVATASKVSGSQSSDVDDGARQDRRTLDGGQRETRDMYEQSGRILGDDVPAAIAGRNAERRIHRSLDEQLCHQPAVKFTRTGDVETNVSMADPAAQPARVASPAAGLHGRYQETDTYADGGRNAEVNFDIQTYCLRTGDRCLSYWRNLNDTKILVFSQNQWVLANTSADATCKNGSRARSKISLQYPLPQPPQDPITLLTGRGHYTVTGECPYSSDFDSRVVRTGD